MYTAIGTGWAPNQFEFYQEGAMTSHDEMGDSIAKIVMKRFYIIGVIPVYTFGINKFAKPRENCRLSFVIVLNFKSDW